MLEPGLRRVVSKQTPSPAERHAIYTVHGEKCYMCGDPLNLKTVQIEHVIPEKLAKDPDKLAEVLTGFGLPPDFDLNSFENLLPACIRCNLLKHDTPWWPSPMIQMIIQRAKAKASQVAALAATTITERHVYAALDALARYSATRDLNDEQKAQLAAIVGYQQKVREPALANEPIRLTPTYAVEPYTVLSRTEHHTVVQGPYGVGGGPTNASRGVSCGVCGYAFFRGAVCVMCGDMDDGS